MSDSRSELMRFLDGGVSPVHTVAMAKEFLTERGFSALPLAEPFSVRRGGRYYIESGSFLAAVTVGSRDTLRIAAAHTDWPCMRIKPDPELVAGGCCRLSVEPYGGAILNSWLDRPLGLAGTVLLRTDDPMRPEQRLIRWDAPLLVIPNLAIHMNREVNKGVPYRANVDMLPICRTMREACEKDGYLVREIAAKLDVRPLDILSFELSTYCYAPSALVGFQQDLLCSPRLDNLTSVHACLRGLVDATGDTINIAVLYDEARLRSRHGTGNAARRLFSRHAAFLRRSARTASQPSGICRRDLRTRSRRRRRAQTQSALCVRCGDLRRDPGALRCKRHPAADLYEPRRSSRRQHRRLDGLCAARHARGRRRRSDPCHALGL